MKFNMRYAQMTLLLLTPMLMLPLSANSSVNDDPVFNQGTIIGKVFHDANVNGYLDDGETGIPGVRIATVTGLVLETDGYGRFHIPDGITSILPYGQNQLLKLDISSLPQGAKITTENPRLMRLSNSGLNKINFGIVF